jgi:hypothetical protein
MTTKKIIVIIGVVVISIVLLIALFVGGIVGIALYSVGNSEAASTAKDFLRNNERLKQDIGTVTDFGSIITGNISVKNGNGGASLNLKVVGEKKTVNASVELMARSDGEWRVVAASYRDESGRSVDLLNAYDARLSPIIIGLTPVGSFFK